MRELLEGARTTTDDHGRTRTGADPDTEATALDVYVRLKCAGVGLRLTGSGIASAQMPADPELRALARTHKAGLMRILLEGAPKVCRKCGLVYISQGIGGPDGPWMIVRRKPGRGMHRTVRSCYEATPEAAQRKLDAYAAKAQWAVAEVEG